jgi:hypothetical protein
VSLRAFHLVFIGASVVLSAFLAAWAMGQYQVHHETTYLAAGAAALAGAVGLGGYAAAFQKKTRKL